MLQYLDDSGKTDDEGEDTEYDGKDTRDEIEETGDLRNARIKKGYICFWEEMARRRAYTQL